MPATFRPSITLPQTGVRWQSGQQIAVRDTVAFVRFGNIVVPIHRIDGEEGYTEGLDDWGPVRTYYTGNRSVWVTPSGREFPTLKEAIAYVRM